MKITNIDIMPDSASLASLVENMCYRCLSIDKIPKEICSNFKITSKWNSALIISSGSQDGMCYALVGYRPDKNGTVIDEDPYIFYFDNNDPTANFGVQIHHGNWKGRTIGLSAEQISHLNGCGQTANLQIKFIPQNTSGSLAYLYQSGSYVGVTEMYGIMFAEKSKFHNKETHEHTETQMR